MLLIGCSQSTRALPPVSGFDAARYAGTWYEIARFPHRFERGLIYVTAEYAIKDDNSIGIVNKGYDPVRRKWKRARARARFPGKRDIGLLKVTFFRPFSAPYKVFHLDKERYAYALVTSGSYDYLWILSRTPHMEQGTLDSLIDIAAKAGFDVSKLEMVEQATSENPQPLG